MKVRDLEDGLVKQYIHDVAGPSGFRMALLIRDTQPVLSVDLVPLFGGLSKDAHLAMYALRDGGVATSRRLTNPGGWETFEWSLTLSEIPMRVAHRIRQNIAALEQRLEELASSEWFGCACHSAVPFERAVPSRFKCPDGARLSPTSTVIEASGLRTEISRLRDTLIAVEQ